MEAVLSTSTMNNGFLEVILITEHKLQRNVPSDMTLPYESIQLRIGRGVLDLESLDKKVEHFKAFGLRYRARSL